MNAETQLKLQSFLDGELSPDEARAMAGLVQQDPAAAALLAELKHSRQAIRQAETLANVPAAREFYWSKISQDIERLGHLPVHRHESWWLAKLRFFVLPAAAVVVLVILGMVVRNHVRPIAPTRTTVGTPTTSDTALANTDTNEDVPVKLP